MSISLTENESIDFIVMIAKIQAVIENKTINPNEIGQMLLNANYNCYNHRYKEFEKVPDYKYQHPYWATTLDFKSLLTKTYKHLKYINYNSCEHPDYINSKACEFNENLRLFITKYLNKWSDDIESSKLYQSYEWE